MKRCESEDCEKELVEKEKLAVERKESKSMVQSATEAVLAGGDFDRQMSALSNCLVSMGWFNTVLTIGLPSSSVQSKPPATAPRAIAPMHPYQTA